MTLLLPEDSASTDKKRGTTARSAGFSWIDLVLLVVVLAALISLLAFGVALPQALTIVGVGGLMTAELRRRLS